MNQMKTLRHLIVLVFFILALINPQKAQADNLSEKVLSCAIYFSELPDFKLSEIGELTFSQRRAAAGRIKDLFEAMMEVIPEPTPRELDWIAEQEREIDGITDPLTKMRRRFGLTQAAPSAQNFLRSELSNIRNLALGLTHQQSE